jgi:hypothetical protein
MPFSSASLGPPGLARLVALVGVRRWQQRVAEIRDLAASGPRAGQALRQRHGVELTLEKLRRHPHTSPSVTEALLGQIASEIPHIAAELTQRGRDRLVDQLRRGLGEQNTLIPVFHLVRTAMTQRARGFSVAYSGLDDGSPHDLPADPRPDRG